MIVVLWLCGTSIVLTTIIATITTKEPSYQIPSISCTTYLTYVTLRKSKMFFCVFWLCCCVVDKLHMSPKSIYNFVLIEDEILEYL